MTQLTRRSFFAKVAGAVVAARAPAPGLASAAARLTGKWPYGYSGGAHIGALAGSSKPAPLLKASEELLAASNIDVAEFVRRAWHDV